jgi:D-alanyl-D-alanine carboxypeptidase/D-alanyl-D-alanine-endopeptidase (penicillin-binding protein 4)
MDTPDRPKSRRRVAVIAGATVLALVIAGVAVLALRPSAPTGPRVAAGPKIHAAGAVLAADQATAPMPTTAGIAAALAGPLKAANLGSHVTAEVMDMATGQVLFGKDRLGPTTPASSMKLATTLSVLATRGPNYRITTRVVAGPVPGEVVLVGAGDPTLGATANPTYPESGRLDLLAAQVKKALGDIKPTKVILDDSLFVGSAVGPGWQKDDILSNYLTSVYAISSDGGRVNPLKKGDSKRYVNSATGAGDVFARYLGLPATAVVSGIAPSAPGDGSSATAPGAVLGSVQSAPLVRIIETMLSNSDNMLAEAMARQVAIATGAPASFSGAAKAVTIELTKLGMPMQGVHIVDGSGISHQNRLTPALLASVISYAAQPSHPQFHAMFTGMPVAGYSGTLVHRFVATATKGADGMLRAKTGTLDGVSALAGFVIDASGRALVFVVLLDKTPFAGAPAALDVIGAKLRTCGCGSPPG